MRFRDILYTLAVLIVGTAVSSAQFLINPYAFAAAAPSGFDATAYGTVLAWYRAEDIAGADASSVAAWDDHGPDNKDLAQATGGLQPTLQTNEVNGYSVARFDGSNDAITAGSQTFANCGTVIVVVGRVTYTSANAVIGAGAKRMVTFFPNSNTVYGGDGGELFGSSVPTRVNGVSTYTFPTNPAFGVISQSVTPVAFDSLRIGESLINDAFNGDILEIVFFAESLSTGQQDAAAADLMAKYGL